MAKKRKLGRKAEAVAEVLEEEDKCRKDKKQARERELCREFFSEE